jgi:hypothetical protein
MRYSQRFLLLAVVLLLSSTMWDEASAQFVQQGNKLVGTGAAGSGCQGFSVSLSADGNTAIVGGVGDSSYAGAAWVFTRSGGMWAQQGNKLVGTGAVGGAWQGWSVSLSADGNTAIVGGPYDSSYTGAAWVFKRSGGVWSQQGDKLVGTGAAGGAFQGRSVSLSADGNTAIVGGPYDSSYAGAAWVFKRSGGVWSQQGDKLVGTGAVFGAQFNILQGWSVSLSADGNTAIVGGPYDGSDGAAWVFTRSGGVWSQQGDKLVGTGALDEAAQGYSVSLSSDGNTAIVGGPNDSSYAWSGQGKNPPPKRGAAWVFTRSGGVWSQQGIKLVGTGGVGGACQGRSVSLSADGNTAIVGGPDDNSNAGAAWVFKRGGGVWSQQGDKLVGTGAVFGAQTSSLQGCSVSLSADGNTAIVGAWRDSSESGAAWVFTRSATGIGERAVEIPQQFDLGQNYPNPFNPSTTIEYELPTRAHVTLTVYNLLGQVVAMPVDEVQTAGYKSAVFNASGLPSGVYLYRLQAGEFVATKKLVVLK